MNARDSKLGTLIVTIDPVRQITTTTGQVVATFNLSGHVRMDPSFKIPAGAWNTSTRVGNVCKEIIERLLLESRAVPLSAIPDRVYHRNPLADAVMCAYLRTRHAVTAADIAAAMDVSVSTARKRINATIIDCPHGGPRIPDCYYVMHRTTHTFTPSTDYLADTVLGVSV